MLLGNMDTRWRKFFDEAGVDIWTVIEFALDLAATDYPHELRMRRDGFVEKLFAHPSLLSKSNGCLPVIACHDVEEAQDDKGMNPPEYDYDHVRNDLSDDEDGLVNSNEEYDEAEALNDAMEEESRQMQEVLRIKKELAALPKDENNVLTALRRLEEMHVSVEALKATEIGKEVNALRKHQYKRVRSLAKGLVRGWKDLVDEWVKSAGDVAAAAMAVSDNGEEGLPSPPLDPGALLASTRTNSIEMSHFFDDFLDDLSAGSGPSPPSSNGACDDMVPLSKRQHQSRGSTASPESQAPKSKGNSISSRGNFGPGRPMDRSGPPKANGNSIVRKFETKPPDPKDNKPTSGQKKPQEPEENMSVAARLEAAKRRLHERYEKVESAKRQRVVQVMELTDLPKGGPNRAKVGPGHASSKPALLNRFRQQQTRR
ncbi:hypothetical protein KC19_VG073300 [Ceratodon purpureus]|uniref:TFIIS N-terminal domain-containing protein n=1 Tax=Ceratodon purpureus TaxID=3225 RepID=A0A8T0HMX0_CERPU|nr:hypothetical protein KC19_VG073300 [Ceratodon purpureus]